MTSADPTTVRPLPMEFSPEGLLPPGDYRLTFDELRTSMLVLGPANRSPSWDTDWRHQLVDNLETLAEQLWKS